MNIDELYVPNCTSLSFSRFGKTFKKPNLSFMTVNMRCLGNKFDELIMYLSRLKQKFTCILITETWLTAQTDSSFEIPEYKSYSFYRENQVGGGLKLYVLDHLNASKIELESVGCESLLLNINIPGPGINQVKICGIYRPPNKPVGDFFNFVEGLLEINTANMVFLGDFNINLNDIHSSVVHRYKNLFVSHGFQNEIDLPTYVSPSGMIHSSCIDHFWRNIEIDRSSYVLKPNISDHLAVSVVFKSELTDKPINIKFRDFSWNNINRYLANIESEFSSFIYYDNVNQFSVYLVDFLVKILNKYFPLKTKSIFCRRIKAPWITSRILKCINRKHRWYRMARNNYL